MPPAHFPPQHLDIEPSDVVRVRHLRVTAIVDTPSAAAVRLLRRTAGAGGCERQSSSRWVVYGSRVAAVVSAFASAGYRVIHTPPATPAAGSASGR